MIKLFLDLELISYLVLSEFIFLFCLSSKLYLMSESIEYQELWRTLEAFNGFWYYLWFLWFVDGESEGQNYSWIFVVCCFVKRILLRDFNPFWMLLITFFVLWFFLYCCLFYFFFLRLLCQFVCILMYELSFFIFLYTLFMSESIEYQEF